MQAALPPSPQPAVSVPGWRCPGPCCGTDTDWLLCTVSAGSGEKGFLDRRRSSALALDLVLLWPTWRSCSLGLGGMARSARLSSVLTPCIFPPDAFLAHKQEVGLGRAIIFCRASPCCSVRTSFVPPRAQPSSCRRHEAGPVDWVSFACLIHVSLVVMLGFWQPAARLQPSGIKIGCSFLCLFANCYEWGLFKTGKHKTLSFDIKVMQIFPIHFRHDICIANLSPPPPYLES